MLRNDVAHTTHLAKWQARKVGSRLGCEPAGGFTNDFEAAEHGILLLSVLHEHRFGHALKIGLDDQRRVKDVPQQAVLFFTEHTRSQGLPRSSDGGMNCGSVQPLDG